MFRNRAGPSLELEPRYFRHGPSKNVNGWITPKVRGDFARAAFDHKADFWRPNHGRWNADDFLAWEDSLELWEQPR